jgi:hypothetical protein
MRATDLRKHTRKIDRYLRINKLREKRAKFSDFSRKLLTEMSSPFTFGLPQLYPCCNYVQVLTEREEQRMRHDDQSQLELKQGGEVAWTAFIARP